MNDDFDTAREDLAFIRSIVDQHGKGFRSIGVIYLSAGLIFGTQVLLAYVDQAGLLVLPGAAQFYIAVIALVLFFGHCGYDALQNRKQYQGANATSRAVAAAFGGAGLANAVLAAVFGYVALTRQDITLWLLFPVVVCALQGAVWFAVALIQRRWWMGAVAAGWFLAALGLGVTIENTVFYLFTLMVTLYGLLGVPGFVIIRISRTET